ncbi:MAG: mechanosensitive ion channel domain-containing protein [Candidatus Neomarinimicrobiota bacterium]
MNNLSTRLQDLGRFYHIRLFTVGSLSVELGALLAGAVFFLIGLKLMRLILHILFERLIRKRVKDQETSLWLEKFSIFIFTIIITILTLFIIGLPVSFFRALWGVTLFTIKDNSIDIGNIVLGLVFLYPGLRFARYLTQEIQTLFIARMKVDLATKKSLEVIIRYSLITLVALFVLTIIGIPLTAFTIIGGALAIGFGLGSQNLVNNFLSGMVLMTERPLKIGDVVELEGRGGTVEHIGGRSTRILTFDNLRMIIPNSKLLENTLVNWTLVDNILRRELLVGVAYGSPVKKVAELILQAANDHKDVEPKPPAKVLFWDFGDNALIFKLMFWMRLRKPITPLEVESDLRFLIHDLLAENGIVIAFPQRDVHLDAVKPIEIRLVERKDQS